jgi:hypothetical protein
MATKDVSDALVCAAFVRAKACDFKRWPYDFLMEWTGQCQKVCYRAMERAWRHNLVDFGVSLRTGWVTRKGALLLVDTRNSYRQQDSTRNPD